MNNSRPITMPSVLMPAPMATPHSPASENLPDDSTLNPLYPSETNHQSHERDTPTAPKMTLDRGLSQPVLPLNQSTIRSEVKTILVSGADLAKACAREIFYKGIIFSDDNFFTKALHQATKSLSPAEVFFMLHNTQKAKTTIITTKRKEHILYIIDIFLALNVNIIGPNFNFILTHSNDNTNASHLVKNVIDEAEKLIYLSVAFNIKNNSVDALSYAFFCELRKNEKDQKKYETMISSFRNSLLTLERS